MFFAIPSNIPDITLKRLDWIVSCDRLPTQALHIIFMGCTESFPSALNSHVIPLRKIDLIDARIECHHNTSRPLLLWSFKGCGNIFKVVFPLDTFKPEGTRILSSPLWYTRYIQQYSRIKVIRNSSFLINLVFIYNFVAITNMFLQ